MKFLMIMVDTNHQEDVERILDAHGVPGYTELPNVLGKGKSGRKFGNRAFPGSSTLYFTVIDEDVCERVCVDLRSLDQQSGPEEGLTAFVLNAEMVV